MTDHQHPGRLPSSDTVLPVLPASGTVQPVDEAGTARAAQAATAYRIRMGAPWS
ncbi:hypothetical protein [Streptomyces zaehneri]|uniref:hypothetical protein n=1 Tax=Streptomyces zaehneri TaxID=3051180 RepID=UPI0028D51954|nr:hypothetical protein [Streptomyces sp. DSM 40713]